MEVREHLLLIISLVVLIAGGIFHMVGMATPAWSKYDAAGNDTFIEMGPFRVCVKILGQEFCDNWDKLTLDSDVETYKDVVAAIIVVGLLAVGAAGFIVLIVLGLALISQRATGRMIYVLATLCAFAGSALTIAGVVLWSEKIKPNKSSLKFTKELGYSIIMCFISAGAFIVGGLLILIHAIKMSSVSNNSTSGNVLKTI